MIRRRHHLALGLGLLVLAPLAQGHQLRVFAYAEGPVIHGSVYFAGGAPAAAVRVEIRDAQGRPLKRLDADDQGAFQYPAEQPVEHQVMAYSADGHRALWTISAAELAPGFPGPPVAPGTTKTAPQAAPPADPGTAAKVIDPALTAAIETAVARQIRPLREELNAAREHAGMQDVLGGLGYIFGLAGLAAWWRSRRRRG